MSIKIAISQPEHFPYIGYFQKMHLADVFVVLDHVKFSGRGSFQNRNRFSRSDGSYKWFTASVAKNSDASPINMVRLAPDNGWREKVTRSLNSRFSNINVSDIYSEDMLISANMKSIELCMQHLQIHTTLVYSSSMNIQHRKGEMIKEICYKLGSTTYISGQGARIYMSEYNFDDLDVFYVNPCLKNLDSAIVVVNEIAGGDKDRRSILDSYTLTK